MTNYKGDDYEYQKQRLGFTNQIADEIESKDFSYLGDNISCVEMEDDENCCGGGGFSQTISELLPHRIWNKYVAGEGRAFCRFDKDGDMVWDH